VDVYKLDSLPENALFSAVQNHNTELVRMLLAAGSHLKPIIITPDYEIMDREDMYMAERAIEHCDIEILTLLLEHGGRVGYKGDYNDSPGLNNLLLHEYTPRGASHETKLAISRILVDHAKENAETAEYFQVVFDYHMQDWLGDDRLGDEDDTEFIRPMYEILVEAGIAGCRHILHRAVENGFLAIWRVFVALGVDPFLRDEQGIDDEESHYGSASPFFLDSRPTRGYDIF
jgi:hypothetical protein